MAESSRVRKRARERNAEGRSQEQKKRGITRIGSNQGSEIAKKPWRSALRHQSCSAVSCSLLSGAVLPQRAHRRELRFTLANHTLRGGEEEVEGGGGGRRTEGV